MRDITVATSKLKSSSTERQNDEVTTSAQSALSKPSNMRCGIKGMCTNKYVFNLIMIPRKKSFWSVLFKHFSLFKEGGLHPPYLTLEIGTWGQECHSELEDPMCPIV